MLSRCPKCLYPASHAFGITFKGLRCSGCITHTEKNEIDWERKFEDLRQFISKFERASKSYDCVVPVVGDAEDFYVLSKVIELGLSPLVVCVNDYFKNDIGWHNLHQLITHFDVDSMVYNPDKITYRELVRTSLRKHDHILLPFLQLHTSFPVHVAYQRKIPLIIWGQNQAVEQVGKFSHLDEVQMTAWSRKEHDLFGIENQDLIGNGAQVSERHMNYYNYPSSEHLKMRGITGIYLSNYFRWDPLSQNSSATRFGFLPQSNNRSFDIYDRAGSSVYYEVHDLLKHKRCGYSKISDHVAREIRHGRLTQDEASKLLEHFSQRPINIKPFLNWLEVSKTGQEWLMRHKFHTEREIVDLVDVTYKPVDLPSGLKPLVHGANSPTREFLTFGKGLQITDGV